MFLLEWLETDRLNVGIFTRWPRASFSSTLRHTSIGSEEVLLVAATDALRPTPDDELSPELILQTLRLALTPGFRLLAQERLDLDTLTQQPEPEIDSVHTIKDLVLRGAACSVLPFTYVRDDLTNGRVLATRFKPGLRRDLVAVTRAGGRATAGVNAVVNAARTRMADLMSTRAVGA